jgi:pyruvate,orthophosphate dikinase
LVGHVATAGAVCYGAVREVPMTAWIESFDAPGNPDPARLGTKGASLVDLTRLGLPVPPGFTLATSACAQVIGTGAWPTGLADELRQAVTALEARTELRLGDGERPLLLAVRSGAAVVMPGMLETVLDLGLNDTTVLGLAASDARFAWDSYRRFVSSFGDVVLGIHPTRFTRAKVELVGDRDESSLDADTLRELTARYLEVVRVSGHDFPQDPHEQLRLAIDAVFRSYNSHRARYYRKTQGIPEDAGTAVTVQRMVFGNRGAGSGTGVLFTRDPKTGAPGPFGEWQSNAQGTDVTGGVVTPAPLVGEAPGALSAAAPDVVEQILAVQSALEAHFRDMQEVEFTVENGRLWLLQTRTGERTAQAAVRIVVDLVGEGKISQEEAIRRVQPQVLEHMLRPVIAPDARRRVLAKGLDASPGAATGRVVFHAADCQAYSDKGEPTILVRNETTPEDIQGLAIAAGVLTARGGQTSHAAVVARTMGKPAVVGCNDIQVDYSRQVFYVGDDVVRRGDWITIDGATGEILEGQVAMLEPQIDAGAMATLLGWADQRARLRVRVNADHALDARRARQLGATGVGLCRTEHMFFQVDALKAMRRMILADDPWARQRALHEILPMQRAAFVDLFREMDGLPVTIRLLDPPLHEFLPQRDEDVAEVAEDLGVRVDALQARIALLAETNPMLGHRGVRLGISTPQIYRVQTRAIFEAACLAHKAGVQVHPEVLVPLVSITEEIRRVRDGVVEVAEDVLRQNQIQLDYEIGTMIEVPRACLIADQIASHADFFSFGTNDLTQLVYGFSRDDVNRFMPTYRREGILPEDPLTTFDVAGVGQLVHTATERGRKARPGLKIGVCGEHGADPVGVRFFHDLGLDYVSCSPFRVPVARLAAAHAALAAR